jgi:hypothetical protein
LSKQAAFLNLPATKFADEVHAQLLQPGSIGADIVAAEPDVNPTVIALAAVSGQRPAVRRDLLEVIEHVLAELQVRDARLGAGHTGNGAKVRVVGRFEDADDAEAGFATVERHGPVKVGNIERGMFELPDHASFNP